MRSCTHGGQCWLYRKPKADNVDWFVQPSADQPRFLLSMRESSVDLNRAFKLYYSVKAELNTGLTVLGCYRQTMCSGAVLNDTCHPGLILLHPLNATVFELFFCITEVLSLGVRSLSLLNYTNRWL